MIQTNISAMDEKAGVNALLSNFPLRQSESTEKNTIKRATLAQINREKFKACNKFVTAFKGSSFFDKSFPANGTITTGCTRATSVMLNRAVCGNYPDFKLCYPLLAISKGKLPGAAYAACAPQTDGNIYFAFTDNSSIGSASKYDTVILVAWVEALQQAVFTLNAALRADCEAVLETGKLKGQTAHTWIGFLSKDHRDASESYYTGSVSL